jgi:hypothetical protein
MRGRELKPEGVLGEPWPHPTFAPMRGRELKLLPSGEDTLSYLFAPMRGRELKLTPHSYIK